MGSTHAKMQTRSVGRDQIEIRHELIGAEDGIPIVLTPGGQNGVESDAFRALAKQLATEHGFRCLLHDRVNNGGSSIFLGRDPAKAESQEELQSPEYRGHGEPPMQAFYLRLLLSELDMLPAFFWGSSSGARMSLFFASLYPDDVRGLVLVNITAGPKAAANLSQGYHRQHAQACKRGGMDAVMQQELFAGAISRRPANAEVLRAMDPAEFIAVEEQWADFLAARDGHPIVGMTSETLASLQHPAFCLNTWGDKNDGLHTPAAIQALGKGLGNCKECLVETKESVWKPRAFAYLKGLLSHGQPLQHEAASEFDGTETVETPEFVFFWRPPSLFSQWTPSEFVVGGVRYDCGEMYMMAEKARLFGDEETRGRILAARGNPQAVKALGREVRGFREEAWEAACGGIVEAGNFAKFSQNPAMRRALLATGHRVLAEASPRDRIWGIGLRGDDPAARDRRQWRGENRLGQALMAVRERLRGEEAQAREAAEG